MKNQTNNLSTQPAFSQTTTAASEVANDWLLPDGVHDVLFADADKQQYLRHILINQLQLKGYELVTPPLIEFTESLLGSASEDLKRQTFKIIDQLTGRLMGVRADTTPQILRIDATIQKNQKTLNTAVSKFGGIARYCYAGHTVHTLPTGLFGLRTPLQLGAEIFGTDSIQADFELLDVVCDLFTQMELNAQIHLDLGHVGIFRRLSELASLPEDVIEQLMQLYDNKALPELKMVCQKLSSSLNITHNQANDFFVMAKYGHDLEALKEKLSDLAKSDRQVITAIDELQQLHKHLSIRLHAQNNIDVSMDVADLSGYHYHSGMMFNVYMNDGSQALLRGGRFDGSACLETQRPAVGFSMDVTRLLPFFEMASPSVVLVDYTDLQRANEEQKKALLTKINELRLHSYRVIVPLSTDDKPNTVTHLLTMTEESKSFDKKDAWILGAV